MLIVIPANLELNTRSLIVEDNRNFIVKYPCFHKFLALVISDRLLSSHECFDPSSKQGGEENECRTHLFGDDRLRAYQTQCTIKEEKKKNENKRNFLMTFII